MESFGTGSKEDEEKRIEERIYRGSNTISKREIYHHLADKYGPPDFQHKNHTPLQTQLYWEYYNWEQITNKRWEFGLAGGKSPHKLGNDFPFEILRHRIPMIYKNNLTDEEWAIITKDHKTYESYMRAKAPGVF